MKQKAYAVVSKKSNNITQYDTICNSFVIFPTRRQAEILIEHWQSGKFQEQENVRIKGRSLVAKLLNNFHKDIPWVIEEIEIIRA